MLVFYAARQSCALAGVFMRLRKCTCISFHFEAITVNF